MKYFSVNSKEFLRGFNTGYYYSALKDIEHLLNTEDDVESQAMRSIAPTFLFTYTKNKIFDLTGGLQTKDNE